MLRGALLSLANQPAAYRLVMRYGALRSLAWRYVAGEDLAAGIAAIRAANRRGLTVTLDHLGENVSTSEEAVASAEAYVEALEAIAREGLDANISLKLTQMGLDVGRDLCVANVRRVLDRARDLGEIFVRLDMESSAYTQRTLDIHEQLWQMGYRNVGVVLQAYLYRTPSDVEREIALGARVRLCKGAYLEPPTVAWPDKRAVDAQYVRLMERLLLAGRYPAIATQDERIIHHARRFTRTYGIGPERFEFQMLYGVRRDLQLRLVDEGYRVRVYVPYGQHWYPYLTRRLAERPANLAFFLRSLVAETLARYRPASRPATPSKPGALT